MRTTIKALDREDNCSITAVDDGKKYYGIDIVVRDTNGDAVAITMTKSLAAGFAKQLLRIVNEGGTHAARTHRGEDSYLIILETENEL